jgi:DNA-binding SARP family transcriptional activator
VTPRFYVLGPIGFRRDDEIELLPGRKAQTLLAALVVSANHVVPADRLIDAVWSGDQPQSPEHALQSQISKLRHVDGADIQRVGDGYLLPATCDDVDACVFERRLREAERLAGMDPRAALATARSAISLWRGPAFGDLADLELFQLEAIRLDELRVAAQELALTAMLEVGQPDEAVAELRAAVADHPYRERLWQALLAGLIQLKRRGEALEAYAEYVRQMDTVLLPPDPDIVSLVDGLHVPLR